MIKEIIDVYSKQLELYNTLKETLERVENSDFDLITYNLEFENADYLMDKIEKLNVKAEQLKVIYVSKNKLNDFIGEEIKRVETDENYLKLKDIIDSITKMIQIVKVIQDRAINKISSEGKVNKRVQSNLDKKNALKMYTNNAEKKK